MKMPSRSTNNFPESGHGLGHVTPTIFGSTVGYLSDSLASCSRWYVVQPADDKISLNSLTAFALGKALKGQIGTLVTVRRLQPW